MARILFVFARAGTPLAYSLPRIALNGEVHVLGITPLPTADAAVWRASCASVIDSSALDLHGEAAIEHIVEHASRLAVDAIFTSSEFAVLAVGEAARRLGLRGVGPKAIRSRDKALMRDTWAAAGVPIPKYRRVGTIDDLRAAFDELSPPLLLKAAWSAGSIGQFVLNKATEIDEAWRKAEEAMLEARTAGFGEMYEIDTDSDFIVEEIINGSTEGWYEDGQRYGPYVSVEGIVAGGVYHPISLTGRMPTIPPFIEPANLAPCVLPEPLQRKIEAVATAAVDALELDTCGTHTEIMLGADHELFVIESAARFGGCMLAKEVETVFGVDMIQMLARELLGEPVRYPERMLTEGSRAAATLALIATDSTGRPWQRSVVWDDANLDWSALVSPGTSVDVVEQMTMPRGGRIPDYDPDNGGALNWAGIFYVEADDAETLLKDCYSVLDDLQYELPEAEKQ